MASRALIVFLLTGFASISGFVNAQVSTPVASPFDGTAFAMSAAELRTASTGVQPERLTDATILYEETDYHLVQSGASTYTHRLVYRLETTKGVENWAEISMEWDPWYQRAPQLHARVLQKDDTFLELDQKTITDGPVNADDEDTYTAARERKAPLPGLAVGSIVEEVVSVEDSKPYFSAGSVHRYYFTNDAPAEREKVVVDLPASMPFQDRYSNMPQLAVSRSAEGGIRHVVYVLDHQDATVYGDIDLPSTNNPTSMLEFATGASWASVARAYNQLFGSRIAPAEVQSLLPTAAEPTRLGKIQQLVQRLHKEIRYTGVEFGEAQLVPEPPSEVLKRHYGDCKDKATVLVSMLRAEGISADLALLSTGTGRDVNPELPGMDIFNHAIVYVPPSGADPALWIDATAEFTVVGSLPYQDADRLALVIAPDTTQLLRTPPATPSDSVLVETRTFHLAELGPSQVVESSETHGYVDALYRSRYGSAITKNTNDDLEHYAQSAYLAKRLVKIDHGDGANLSKPFYLTLSLDGARRGITDLTDSAVGMFPANTLFNLPEWIKTAPAPLPENATPEEKKDRAQAEARRSPTYHIQPFIAEQRYVVYPPPGFTLRALPADRTTAMGPGSLTEHYVQQSSGVLEATFRFTTGKSVLTPQEALDLRQAVADVYRRDSISIVFEENGAKLLQAGKVKEALAADQATILQNPKSALPHVRMARALLSAGVGEMARSEAAKAVALDPSSAAALTTQAWILEHDLLGKRFGPGFDREAAIAAYRRALPLDSQDFDPRFDLAILYEFDANGARYSPDANLSGAIELYRSMIETEKKKQSSSVQQYQINLGYSLFFHRDYKQLDQVVQEIPSGINRSTLTVASAVAQQGVAAGLAAADRLNLSLDDRNKALLSAGNSLAQVGLYQEAAEVLSAGIQGQSDAPAIAHRIEIFKNLHRVPLTSPPVNSPESLVFSAMNVMMSGTLDRKLIASLTSPHAYPSAAAFDRDIDKGLQSLGLIHNLAQTSSTSEVVLRDTILGSMNIKSTGDDATGYRVLCQFLGQNISFFVVREDGVFHIVAEGDNSDNAEVGYYALYALDHNQPALAGSILNWKREFLHRGGGDDPLEGELLPRFWTVGSPQDAPPSAEAMRIAATALAAGSMELKPHLDDVASMREKATGSRQLDLDLLLARAYLGTEQPTRALPYIADLLKNVPDSITAVSLAGQAYAMQGDAKSWSALISTRLAQRADDSDLLRQKARLLILQHDYAGARQIDKAIFDSGHATANDYNVYAWLGLFDGSFGPDITSAAQQANTLSRNGSFSNLHTTSCIYAAQGKTTEARQVLAQAMAAGNLTRPNSEVWFALGLLYENYGLEDAAIAAYNRVQAHDFDDHTYVDPESAYILAQQRIKGLIASRRSEPASAKLASAFQQ